MSFTPQHALRLAALLALPFALGPEAATAQEAEATEVQACTAVLSPALVPAGEAVVKVLATLTQDIGTIDGLKAPEGSGLAIVSPEDVPMEEMANSEGEATAEATEMVDAEDTFIVWLNALEANAGEFDITLVGELGTCTATVEVTPAG